MGFARQYLNTTTALFFLCDIVVTDTYYID